MLITSLCLSLQLAEWSDSIMLRAANMGKIMPSIISWMKHKAADVGLSGDAGGKNLPHFRMRTVQVPRISSIGRGLVFRGRVGTSHSVPGINMLGGRRGRGGQQLM
ncbi:hypothetical protein BDZ91DRAFT_764584 [Kalaharituber pfeilii]|nr:hypothetical protein BDZ91DRAFT_764584 [Kalaharituber pfeilii]